MQLAPLNTPSFPLSLCEITACLNKAFREFPANILHNLDQPLPIPQLSNFAFQGHEEVAKFVLFTLLDILLWSMRDAGHNIPDQLKLTTSFDTNYNYLHLLNIGNKITSADIPNLFSNSANCKLCPGGSTIGLHFCKKAMHYFGGDISYNAGAPEGFIEFVMKFPKLIN